LDDKPVIMKKRFKRDISSLENIFAFVEGFLSSHDIASPIAYSVQLAIEELFTNILKYQSDGKSDVVVSLEKSDTKLVIQLLDFDSEPFDLTESKDINTHEYIQRKEPGGLGIHLVKQMVDSIDYQYNNRTTTITLTKHLEK